MNRLIIDEMRKRDEIVKTFYKNYLLEAGAGAGKTTIIVQRIINQILNEDIDPSNIVAITFTKKASMELAERIQKEALKCLLDEKDLDRINRLKSVDKMFTGTIHSFCQLMLSELPFDADLTPGYEIVEDDEEFHTNIWYNFLRDKQKDYKELADILEYFGIDYLKLNSSVLLALNNPDVKFTGYEPVDYKEIFKDFEKIKEEYKDLKYKNLGKQKSIARLVNSILEDDGELKEYTSKFYNAFNGKDFVFDIDVLYNGLIKKGTEIDEPERFKALIYDLYDLNLKIQKIKYNTCTEFVNMVVDYKKKYYKGKLTFNDLLYKASKLIRESVEAREHFKDKYKCFYIDEFQDTDPMQAELLLYLTHSGSYDGIRDWNDFNPLPGSLFVVGDPKQSIYRFRRADITTYNKVKTMIEKTGEVVYLDINFRSSDCICDWVQDTFKKKEDSFGFEEESSSYQAGFKKILSLWDDKTEELDKQLLGVNLYDYPDRNDEYYVANMVKNLIDDYYIAEKVSTNTIDANEKDYYNQLRSVKASDIMILTKTNEETGVYLRALKKMDIQALLSGEKILGSTREVMNLYILVDALTDYKNNVKLVSALRNSFYIDLETIDLFMEEDKNLAAYIFNKKKQEKISHPSIRNAFEAMSEMISMTRDLSPVGFLEKIVEDRAGIFDIHREYGVLELKDANSSIRQTIEIIKSKRIDSFYELKEELKNLMSKKVSNELPLNEYESKNAVRIMNIHKAKGLEADIVILVGGSKRRSASLKSPCHFVCKNEEGENIGYINYPDKNFKTMGPNEKENRDLETDFISAEVDRLLYVAATRAKSVLIVANAEDEANFIYPLSSQIDNYIDIGLEDEINEDTVEELSYEKQRELALTKDLRIQKEISTPSYIKLVPSKFKLEDREEKQDYILVKRGPKLKHYNVKKYKKDIYKDPRGPLYGTIVHRAIEILMKKGDNLQGFKEEDIKYATSRALNEIVEKVQMNSTTISQIYHPLSPMTNILMDAKLNKGNKEAQTILKKALQDFVEKVLSNFVNNQGVRELLLNVKEVYTEMPFTIAIDKENMEVYEMILGLSSNESGKEFLINGTMDLVIKNQDDTWTILDYKTNTIGMGNAIKTLKRLYTPQLKGYKILFEEILKEGNAYVKDLIIYSTYIDELIYL